MYVSLAAVLNDGSIPGDGTDQRQQFRQDVSVPRAEQSTVAVLVLKQDGTPVDLTGGSMRLTLRAALGDVSPALAKNGVLDSDPTTGKATISIASAATAGLAEGREYYYDVYVTIPDDSDADDVRWQVVPLSRWTVAPIVSYPGEAET